MRTFSLVGAVLAGVVVAVSAAGCTAEAHLTVPASNVAKGAADALEQQVGQRPVIDCGSEQVDLVDGKKIHCDVGAKGDPTTYDSVVTISQVKGTDYHVDIEVDTEPEK